MSAQERREQTLRLAFAAEEVRRKIIDQMNWQDLVEADVDYERWVDRGQIEPSSEGWRTWLILAGRGFGKTRTGAEWIYRLGKARRGVRIALVGATLGDARSVMVEGPSGLLSIARAQRERIEWEPTLRRLRWPNGSEAEIFSGDNADGLRGPEHDFAWCAADAGSGGLCRVGERADERPAREPRARRRLSPRIEPDRRMERASQLPRCNDKRWLAVCCANGGSHRRRQIERPNRMLRRHKLGNWSGARISLACCQSTGRRCASSGHCGAEWWSDRGFAGPPRDQHSPCCTTQPWPD